MKRFTGFHEFAEFTKDDVGTDESGVNSVVLANNDETVLLPMTKPVFGAKRRPPIRAYLEIFLFPRKLSDIEGAGLSTPYALV
ncbi:hypothetical protein NL676_017255 [Syzygium grande]|nr:hypothetical protein NL676_017255 [Syzygium grande]